MDGDTNPGPRAILHWTRSSTANFVNYWRHCDVWVKPSPPPCGDWRRTRWWRVAGGPVLHWKRSTQWCQLWAWGLHSSSLGFINWSQKRRCCYSNRGKKKAVVFVDEKLSAFFVNVGGKLRVGEGNPFHQPGEGIEISHSKCPEVGSETWFPEASWPSVNARERGFINPLCFLMGFVN